MVKMMEDQQDRAQAQRTRLEKRIAKLEVTLQTNKEQRYVRKRSSSLPKVHANSEQDRLSQNYFSDSDQTSLQHSSSLNYYSYKNQYDSVARRSDVLFSSIASQTDNQSLQDYEDYTPRQISSDEEQPYICERCRQETALLEKDDGQWSDKDHTDDNVRESFHDWFTDPSTLEMNKYSVNKHNFHGDGYVCNSPTTIGSRKCTDAMYNLHEETNSMVDSSRESIDPYQRQNYPHHRHLLYYRIRPSLTNRTNSHEVDL